MYDGDQDGFEVQLSILHMFSKIVMMKTPVFIHKHRKCSNNIDENCDGLDPLTCTVEDPTIQVPSSITQCSWHDLK